MMSCHARKGVVDCGETVEGSLLLQSDRDKGSTTFCDDILTDSSKLPRLS